MNKNYLITTFVLLDFRFLRRFNYGRVHTKASNSV
jgi:hypothetical protein